MAFSGELSDRVTVEHMYMRVEITYQYKVEGQCDTDSGRQTRMGST